VIEDKGKGRYSRMHRLTVVFGVLIAIFLLGVFPVRAADENKSRVPQIPPLGTILGDGWGHWFDIDGDRGFSTEDNLHGELLQACMSKRPASELPVPSREALCDYFAEYLFYDFQPDLFWPHYPDHWLTGMKNVYRHAIEKQYGERNFHEAVQLLPLFFTEEEVARFDKVSALNQALVRCCEKMNGLDNGYQLYARGCRFWCAALMKHAKKSKQVELVNGLFVETARNNNYGGPHFVSTLLGLDSWFNAHPAELRRILEDDSTSVRQAALSCAVGPKFCLEWDDPLVTKVLIEGLKDDDCPWNHGLFSARLLAHADETRSAVRRAFAQTTDWQQKDILCALLVQMKDKKTRKAQLEHLYAELHSKEGQPRAKADFCMPIGLPPGKNADSFPYERGDWHRRDLWAPRSLATFGTPAVDFLLKKLPESTDPQQLALSLLVIQELGAEHRIKWNDAMIRTLLVGLEHNTIAYDQGFTTFALKSLKGTPGLSESLKRLYQDNGDSQLKASVETITAYLDGDWEGYLQKKKESNVVGRGYPYWEYTSLWERALPRGER